MLNYQRVDHFYWKPHEVFGYPFLYLVASPCGSQWHAEALLVDGSRKKRLDDWHLGCEFIAKHPGEQSFHSCTSGKMMKNGSVLSKFPLPTWGQLSVAFSAQTPFKVSPNPSNQQRLNLQSQQHQLLPWIWWKPIERLALATEQPAMLDLSRRVSAQQVSWRRLLPYWVGLKGGLWHHFKILSLALSDKRNQLLYIYIFIYICILYIYVYYIYIHTTI